jgi:hypothetical protein
MVRSRSCFCRAITWIGAATSARWSSMLARLIVAARPACRCRLPSGEREAEQGGCEPNAHSPALAQSDWCYFSRSRGVPVAVRSRCLARVTMASRGLLRQMRP